MTIENAKITNVSITMEDHGCLTFWVILEGEGWGCGYGGYCIGHGSLDADDFKADNGNGLVAMMKIMDTIGVTRWEDLKGQYCRVKLGSWGSKITMIGNIIKNKWFNIEEFFSKGEEQ